MKCLRTEPSLRLYLPTCFQLEPWKEFTKQYASFQISKESILSKLYCYASFSSKDQLEELQYDVDNAIPDINGWKAHILRAAHQDTAKSVVIENLANNQVLIIMDWAMKFLPIGYRETQRDWFGKKGKSWHVSIAVKKGDDGEIEVEFQLHLGVI